MNTSLSQAEAPYADHVQYSEKQKSGCTDATEAEQIFQKHREFLLMSFLQRTYGISWSNTPIYQTIRRQFPVRWIAQPLWEALTPDRPISRDARLGMRDVSTISNLEEHLAPQEHLPRRLPPRDWSQGRLKEAKANQS
jgi:hypothetical protein